MEENLVQRDLARQVDKILIEELTRCEIDFSMASARVWDTRTVGVQGDGRTYNHPAEIILYQEKNFVWDPEFLARLSNRITNEVSGINRVVYTTAKKD